MPRAPSVPSAPTAITPDQTIGLMASGSSCGEPSVTIPETRSGRRRASTFAKWPPRLWPTMAARRPWRCTSSSSRSSRFSIALPEQFTFIRMPARLG